MKTITNEDSCIITKKKLEYGSTSIPVLEIVPDTGKADYPVILLFHGFTSNKEEWLEKDGYTKGGNLVSELLKQGFALIAFDMYGHGEHIDNPENADYDKLTDDDDIWVDFYNDTVHYADQVLNYIKKSSTFNNTIGLISYSMGSIFAVKTANRRSDIDFVVNLVPATYKEYDDEYAPYNNMDDCEDIPFFIVVGKEDEDFPLAESEWYFDTMPMKDKKMIKMDSDHSLPASYVPYVVKWIDELDIGT